MTVAQALQSATHRLARASPTPRLDAEVLLAHVLRTSRTHVLMESQRHLSPKQLAAFEAVVERRAGLEPVAYITGHKEFYGLDFVVDRRVLVPRPETELLVELALGWARRQVYVDEAALAIADIGTGSGCLAVTLALHLPQAQIWAVDVSTDALDVARLNAARHGVAERIIWLHGAGCAPLPQPVALIVSNPPYTVLAAVDPSVRHWEPHLALDGRGPHGFEVAAQLIRQLPAHLQPRGAALIEIGAWQGPLALETAREVFPDARITLRPDLAGHDRVLMIET
jgi:release factor glutamine methyltransferase